MGEGVEATNMRRLLRKNILNDKPEYREGRRKVGKGWGLHVERENMRKKSQNPRRRDTEKAVNNDKCYREIK